MEFLESRLKDREVKYYANKAEVFISKHKKMKSIPTINSQSRKIAKALTTKEIEKIGLKSLTPKIKPKNNIEQSCVAGKKSQKKSGKNFNIVISQKEDSSHFEDEQNPVQGIKRELISPIQNRLITNASVNHTKQELKSDFLDLDAHCVGSSFHTTELEELEMVSSGPGCDRTSIELSPVPFVHSERSNKPVSTKASVLNYLKYPQQPIQERLLRGVKSAEFKEKCLQSANTQFSPIKYPSFLRPTSSQNLSNPVFQKCFSNKIMIPRCHIDLQNCKSTPPFFEVVLPAQSKVKTPNGIGSADTLRHFLLSNKEKSTTPNNRIFKDAECGQTRQRQIGTSNYTKSMDFSNSDVCSKKRTDSDQVVLEKQKNIKNIAKNVMKVTAYAAKTSNYYQLSPAFSQIRYSQGCNSDRVSSWKPMVKYSEINLLK